MLADEPKHWDDEKFERDEGVLTPDTAGETAGCDQDSDDCAPDEVVGDPIDDKHVPGTADDLPYDYGIETPAPADQALEAIGRPSKSARGVGATGPAEEGEESALGEPDEKELWRKQEPLIEIAEAEEQHYRGLTEEQAEAAHDALAEDAEDPLPNASGGTSATGSGSETG